MARPTDYNPEIALIICSRISEGETLRAICREPGMPTRQTIFTWTDKHKEFLDQYRRAREFQADAHADEVRDLPYECEALGLDASYTKLKMDGCKWSSSKGNPKKYGDRTIHAGDEESPVVIKNTVDDSEVLKRYIEMQRSPEIQKRLGSDFKDL